jgi:hypothetical protein
LESAQLPGRPGSAARRGRGAPENFVRRAQAVELHGGHLRKLKQRGGGSKHNGLGLTPESLCAFKTAQTPHLSQRSRRVLVGVHSLRQRAVRPLDILL